MQDEQEVTSEASWNAMRGKEEDGWRLEPERDTETLETKVLVERGWSPNTLVVKVAMSGCK